MAKDPTIKTVDSVVAGKHSAPSSALVQEYLPDITKFVFLLALVFGVAELIGGDFTLGVVDTALAGWLFLLVLNMKTVQRQRFAGEMLLLPSLLILVASAFLTPNPGYIWAFPGAAAIFLLTDRRAGIPIAIVFIGLVLMGVRGHVADDVLIRIGVNLSAIAAICFFFRNRLERSMKANAVQRELLDQARQAKSDFIDNVSHEMRTPLTAIRGFSEILSKPTGEEIDRAELLEKIRLNATYLNFQIGEIIDCSRFQDRELELSPESTDISELASGVLREVSDVQKLFGTSSAVALKNTTIGELPRAVMLDAEHVRVTLERLMIQAIQGTETGHIELQTEYDNDRGQIAFTVRDTGVDITSVASEIGGQVIALPDDGQQSSLNGIGLGLQVSQQIAQAMGGEIRIDVAGPENIVRMELPAPAAEQEALKASGLERSSDPLITEDSADVAPAPAQAAAFQPRVAEEGKALQDERESISHAVGEAGVEARTTPCVLVTDDSKTNRMLMALLIKELGYETAEASDGMEALESFDPELHDAILMDIQMPGMDGIETTRAFRERGVNIPIFAISAGTSLQDADISEKRLFNGILSKPIDRDLFLSLMRQFQLAAPEVQQGVG